MNNPANPPHRPLADGPKASYSDLLFADLQQLLPTRLLSWCMYRLTRITWPWLKNPFIRVFMHFFRISLAEAQVKKAEEFASFNEFFTRALAPGARPLAAEPSLLCPVDGTVSQLGAIEHGRIFQAKGHSYTAAELLGDEESAAPFIGGQFATIYLAPYNYHRIHMPVTGSLLYWRYIPGRLFSVNAATARALPRLFARNERVVAVFDTRFGTLAMVLVGALFVGSMETVWAGQISPPHRRGRAPSSYTPMSPVQLLRGAEMGRFNMGSTVILLTAGKQLAWDERLLPTSPVRVGEKLARPV